MPNRIGRLQRSFVAGEGTNGLFLPKSQRLGSHHPQHPVQQEVFPGKELHSVFARLLKRHSLNLNALLDRGLGAGEIHHIRHIENWRAFFVDINDFEPNRRRTVAFGQAKVDAEAGKAGWKLLKDHLGERAEDGVFASQRIDMHVVAQQ